MNTIFAFAFATAIVFSHSLHAHSCSGGVDGGMDATGNQCNDPISATARTTGSASVRPLEHRWTDGSGRMRPLAVRPLKSSLPQYRSTAFVIPGSRVAAGPAPGRSSRGTELVTGTVQTTCSGGADGGMDAGGNQCSAPLAGAEYALATDAKAP